MPKFGSTSKLRLTTCHPEIRAVMNDAIKVLDFSIITGRRDEEQQTAAYEAGNSQVPWPESTHNTEPLSEGIDIAPYPINWKDTERFVYLAGIIMGIAFKMGIDLRWGGDWDRDTEVLDEKFRDFGHFEVILPLDKNNNL